MRAIVRDKYGPPEVLALREIDKPEVADDAVLVRVHAASVNRFDWYALTGTPWVGRVQSGVLKPKEPRVGVDFAGTVEAVGKDVAGLRPGDEVYGGRTGAFAEYVSVRGAVVPKPGNATFEEAAAVPMAGVTALQGLRDKGQLKPGQKVLINGASGGVGTFAVQIAKALGAEVTAVCSTRNVETARSLGADHVVDYTKQDFTESGQHYDLMLDVAGSRSWSESTRVLAPGAPLVLTGVPLGKGLFGPLKHVARIRLASLRGSQKLAFFIAKYNRSDLDTLRDLIDAGKVKPVVERRYSLADTADALRYMGEGHAQGKTVISTDDVPS